MPASYRAARHRRSPVETSAIFGGIFGGGAAKRDAAKTALLDAIEAAGFSNGFDEIDFDLPPMASWQAPLATFAAVGAGRPA